MLKDKNLKCGRKSMFLTHPDGSVWDMEQKSKMK
jgi:hypothetical protein